MMKAPVPPSAVLDHWIYSVFMMILHRYYHYSFSVVLLSGVPDAWHTAMCFNDIQNHFDTLS